MNATERARIRTELDTVIRLRMENTQLKDDVLRCRQETSRQWQRAEFWKARAKNASRRADEERRERLQLKARQKVSA